MDGKENIVGQAKTVLVVSDGQSQLGAITTIFVSAKNTECKSCKLCCTGSPEFDEHTIEHYRKNLLPIFDSICNRCNIPYSNFGISAENLQAAAINDAKLEINGFSADVSVFIAILSALLGIAVSQNFVFSGHISRGNILPVASLPIKLETAIAGGFKRFYCCSVNTDDSLASIDKAELDAADDAIRRYRRQIQIKCTDDIFDIFEDVFSDSDILLASINTGVFGKGLNIIPELPSDYISKKICSIDMYSFRKCVSTITLAKDFERVYLLWKQLLTYFINDDQYPRGCGRLLYEYMCGIPPHIRRSGKLKIPFIEMDMFPKLWQLAGSDDYDDIAMLFDGIRGKYLTQGRTIATGNSDTNNSDDCSAFDTVVLSITAKHLDEKYGISIDQARSSFVVPTTTVTSHDDFLDILEAYYTHLSGFTCMELNIKNSYGNTPNQAYRLLERSFADKGGFAEARCRAIDGSKGGLRSVLDEMTSLFKRDIYSDHVFAVFKRAIDIKNDQEKRAFIVGALKRLSPFLPLELRSKAPEFLVDHTEELARVYVSAVDSVRHTISRL